jgi:hypothetical protein
MFEIKPIEVDIPEMLSPTEELGSIMDGYVLGVAVREVAIFRIWRLWRTDAYAQIYADGRTDPMFSSDGEFVKFLQRRLDISRSKVYTRMRTYTLMEFLEYSEREIVLRMAAKPTLYEKALHLIYTWNQETKEVEAYKTDKFGDNPWDGESKAKVRYFLDELENADSIADALKLLQEETGTQPIRFTFSPNENVFVLSWKDDDYEPENGMSILGETIVVTYSADAEVPDWVSDELARKFGERV